MLGRKKFVESRENEYVVAKAEFLLIVVKRGKTVGDSET